MEIYDLMKMSLDATNIRSKVIANNIANINTIGYKRKYVTFEETLDANLKSKPEINVKTDESYIITKDGNNVNFENEKINQASTTLQYNALVSLTNTKLAMAKSVISGR